MFGWMDRDYRRTRLFKQHTDVEPCVATTDEKCPYLGWFGPPCKTECAIANGKRVQ